MSPEIESILKADKYGRTSYAYFCGGPEVIPIDINRQVISGDISKENNEKQND